QATGIVEPENRVLVAPSANGTIEEMLVREGDMVRKGQVMAWHSSSERTALLDSVNIKTASPDERKMVEQAYKLIPVVASIDGKVIKRAAEPGQSVAQGKEIVILADRLIVKTSVDETDIGAVREGQTADFYLDAFPKDKYAGSVVSIAHDATEKEGVTAYAVKVLPSRPIPVLRSGMTADMLITTKRRHNVVYLPKKAVSYRDGDTYVKMRDAGGKKVLEKNVSVGDANEKYIEVASGLSLSDTVYYSTAAVEAEGTGVQFTAN
ncbi:MAG: HlyD family efflux transporter periplasmic adaptor subunit, partial [Elusimicrobiales bacterium]|nr:HlyD family efflux transporter periplasmic adaptor subunit [Elusimicrobiales bacterium]